jgi:hypothetical protein
MKTGVLSSKYTRFYFFGNVQNFVKAEYDFEKTIMNSGAKELLK